LFNKILVGYDGSVQSVNAIKLASDFAKKFKSNVHAVYVLPKYKEFTKSFTLLERELYKDWIDNDLINKNSLKLDNIKRDLKKKHILTFLLLFRLLALCTVNYIADYSLINDRIIFWHIYCITI
jgi:nucleotide-binding universal stress UspA family protein